MPVKPRTPRTGKYDGLPVDRARYTDEDPAVTCREADFFAQENAGGLHLGHGGDTALGAAKGNRMPQAPAPDSPTGPNPFKNLRGGR